MMWFSRFGPSSLGSHAMASMIWHSGQGWARFDHSPVATDCPSRPSFTTPFSSLSYVAMSIMRRPISLAHGSCASSAYRKKVGAEVYWL